MRYGFFAAGVLAVSIFVMTSAQAAGAPRIGVVNLQDVIAKSQAGQQANQKLQDVVKTLRSQANDRKQKLDVLQQQLDKADKKAANYPQLQKSYNDANNDLQQFVLMGRQDLDQRRQELLQPIDQELGRALDQYAKTHHYDILLSKDAAGAVYASDKYDVTQGVITTMDKDWAQMQKSQSTKAPSGKSGG
ncbi:MAG: OmpH family outer membrane protein [Gammaproteobacteria bacterium]